jgi:hypothetical protein
MNIFGYGRGSLSEAAVEALSKWCAQHDIVKSETERKEGITRSNSDPIARAEERPGINPSGKGEDSSSALPVS